MLDELFTPVQSSYFAVTRWDTSVQPGVMQMFAGHVSSAKGETTVRRQDLIPTLMVASEIKHGVRSMDFDPTMVWIGISNSIYDITNTTMRSGGTFIVVSQAVRAWLEPFKPGHIRAGWIVDESAGARSALVAYHGLSAYDGGYPARDNGDGTITVYDVHDLDLCYYRTVRFDKGDLGGKNQQVKLNW